MRFLQPALLLFSSASLSMSAIAHPHSFIDMKNEILVEKTQLKGFKMAWTLDEIASSELIYEMKSSTNQAQTRKTITNDLIKTAIESHYFSTLYDQYQQPIKFTTKPSHYYFEMKDGRITFFFTFYLAQPQELKNQRINLFTYEPSYYISMTYNSDNDLRLPNEQCKVELIEPKVNRSLKLYASGLDRDQSPDMPGAEGLSLGAQFAQKVSMICH